MYNLLLHVPADPSASPSLPHEPRRILRSHEESPTPPIPPKSHKKSSRPASVNVAELSWAPVARKPQKRNSLALQDPLSPPPVIPPRAGSQRGIRPLQLPPDVDGLAGGQRSKRRKLNQNSPQHGEEAVQPSLAQVRIRDQLRALFHILD